MEPFTHRGLLLGVAYATLLTVLASLPACQGSVTGVRRASPKPTVNDSPVASPMPRASAEAPEAPATGLLQRPIGEFRELSGTVQLEARYAVARGSATVVANNGANVLRLGDAGLIANNGSNLIANNASNIISDNGGGLISDHGGGLISDKGGALNTGLASQWWGLLAETDAAPEFGNVIPAAGLAVGVVDLASGRLLSLGQDPTGRKAYAVVTDAAGGFRLYLPAVDAGTVRIVGVPRTGADPRLRTAVLSSRLGAEIHLDEDTAQVASDLRQIMASNFYRTVYLDEAQLKGTTDLFSALIEPRVAAELVAGGKKMLEAYRAANVQALSPERQAAIALRLSDVVLANCRLDELRSLSNAELAKLGPFRTPKGDTRPGEPALIALSETMAKIRRSIGKTMEQERIAGRDPEAYFAAKTYIREAEERDKTSYAIRKPSDFSEFLVRGVQANPALNSFESTLLLGTILSENDIDLSTSDTDTFVRAQIGISLALSIQTYSGDKPILPAVLTALAEAVKQP